MVRNDGCYSSFCNWFNKLSVSLKLYINIISHITTFSKYSYPVLFTASKGSPFLSSPIGRYCWEIDILYDFLYNLRIRIFHAIYSKLKNICTFYYAIVSNLQDVFLVLLENWNGYFSFTVHAVYPILKTCFILSIFDFNFYLLIYLTYLIKYLIDFKPVLYNFQCLINN